MEEGTSHLEDQVMTTLVSTVILGRRLENSVVEEIVKINFGRTKKNFRQDWDSNPGSRKNKIVIYPERDKF